jgi:hypothetical protein
MIKPLRYLLLCAATSGALYAQASVTGSLTILLIDPAGAAIPGAKTILSSERDNFKREAKTSEDGSFTFQLLPPGQYTLSAERDGFKPVEVNGLLVQVGDQLAFKVKMMLGTQQETITVEAGSASTQQQGADVSLVVGEKRLQELPLNGKSFQKLINLSTGLGVPTRGLNSTNPSVSGARPVANNYTIDGNSLNDEQSATGLAMNGGGAGFSGATAAPAFVPTESLQEFRIVASNADATFGRGSGGQIAIITRSGTNEYHGSAYEYFRNRVLDARDFFNAGPFFDAQGRAETPPFRQNLYGAAVGGPIVKDRHFFFANFEGFRQRLERTGSTTVPNADLTALMPGDLGRLYRAFFIDTKVIPATGNAPGVFAPAARTAAAQTQAVAAGFPAALFDGDVSNGEAGSVTVSGTNRQDINQDVILVRTDHHFGDRWSLAARYNQALAVNLTNTSGLPTRNSATTRNWHSGMAQLRYAVRPSQWVELRAGLLRTRYTIAAEGLMDKRFVQLGVSEDAGLFLVPAGTGLSNLSLSGNAGFVDNETVPQFSVTHFFTRGRVSMQSGVDVRWVNLNISLGQAPNYNFNGFIGAAGILGSRAGQVQPVTESTSAVLFGANGGPTSPMRGWRSPQQEYFTHLDWRVRRGVTVDLGLRYSYHSVYREVNNAASNLYAADSAGKPIPHADALASGAAGYVVAPIGRNVPFYQPDRNNWQPRAGLAWDVASRGKTVLRAGYGLYTDRIYQFMFSNGVTNAPFAVSSVAANLPFQLAGALPVNAQTPTVRAVDPLIRNPYTHRFNVGVQQAVGTSMSVTASYVGLRAEKLFRWREINGGGSVPQSLRPDPKYSDIRTVGNYSSSRFDSLQISATRRFVRGFDVTVAYTYGRSLDDSSQDTTGTIQQSLINRGASGAPGFQGGGAQFIDYPVSADYSYSDFDIRHVLSVSHVVELPFGSGRHWLRSGSRSVDTLLGGWSLSGLLLYRTGEPFSVFSGVDFNDDGSSATDRPALLSGSPPDLYANGSLGRRQWLLLQRDAQMRLGTPANVTDPFASIARNAFRAPRVLVYDVSMNKQLRLSERLSLRVEANFFNVFNHANFAPPATANQALSSSRFGELTVTRTNLTPRQIQFGLKLAF